MITKDELQELFASTETYRIERTTSTTDKDKFGEAVCAFANDMPDSGKPGYLLVGVRNDGSLNGLKASDELLQKFAALRSDGNILPIPSIAVDSFSFPDGDVIVVEVQPSDQPPVRYRGRTWIRIGPRRDIASPAEETMLAERKARNFTTFDARPCFDATLDDLDLDLFQHDYLPKAVDAEVLAADDRPIERKLESLRFFNSAYGLPTNAAILLFGKDPRRFFPGAYVQYVSFGGRDKAATILNEHPFKGPIVRMLAQVDLFIETTIARKRPVFVTALREETRTDYPKGAIRELVMNAIMHRDYQGNAPIHFYQYADRLEIVNHGGLYGRARPENFPNVSDYRNPIIAEAMKVLGYVNCYNRGINMVQDELDANGNGKAEFSFRLITAFEAKVALAGNRLSDKLPESGTMDGTIDGTLALRIVSVIEKEPSVTMDQLSEKLSVARRTLVRYMNILQENKRIKRVGGKRFGHWEVVE
ncbi:MAG: putative DNA binding domain-containing protein [Kiritimatiellae bacterium]|nr:putative DNA binding domain-containing protein [Kiritimatiellia bacterium]